MDQQYSSEKSTVPCKSFEFIRSYPSKQRVINCGNKKMILCATGQPSSQKSHISLPAENNTHHNLSSIHPHVGRTYDRRSHGGRPYDRHPEHDRQPHDRGPEHNTRDYEQCPQSDLGGLPPEDQPFVEYDTYHNNVLTDHDDLPLGVEAKSSYIRNMLKDTNSYKEFSSFDPPLSSTKNFVPNLTDHYYNENTKNPVSTPNTTMNTCYQNTIDQNETKRVNYLDDIDSQISNVPETPTYDHFGRNSISDSGLSDATSESSLTPDFPFDIIMTQNTYPVTKVPFIDTHCHLDYMFVRENHVLSFRSLVKRKQFPSNFSGCITCFCDPPSLEDEVYYTEVLSEDGVWGTFGLHPHNAGRYSRTLANHITKAMSHPKALAWGEIGLDYYTNVSDQTKRLQQQAFTKQLKRAVKISKPVVIHARAANEDAFDILKKYVPEDHKIHYHCYSGTLELAVKMMEHFPNMFLGITGILTYSNSTSLQNIVREIPFDRLLVETDSPFLRPYYTVFLDRDSPKTSTPGMALIIAQKISELKKLSLDDVLTQLRENVTEMYGI